MSVDDGADDRMSVGELTWRALWIAVRLVLVIHLGQQGALFFYQKF